MKKPMLCVLLFVALVVHTAAAESDPPASPEVTAAMKPYLDSYKLAGVVSLIADKSGKVHYKNPDQWAARDLFLKTAMQVFQKDAR